MKVGINQILEVKVGIPLDEVESIKFVFSQFSERKLFFTYPSEKALRGENDTIELLWSKEESYLFMPDKTIFMDSFIKLFGSDNNPETPIIKLMMNPTLFKENET